MAATRRRRSARRARPPRRTLRWIALGTLAFVAFLYYRPISSYVETRAELRRRSAEVDELRAERARLLRQVRATESLATLERDARRLSLVRPGERLFIVKGVDEWRRAHRKDASR